MGKMVIIRWKCQQEPIVLNAHETTTRNETSYGAENFCINFDGHWCISHQ